MSFMKRTEFTDDLDQEIYIFKLMLDLAINCHGKMKAHGLTFKSSSNHEIKITDRINDRFYNFDTREFKVNVYHGYRYNTLTHWAASSQNLDIMNFWVPARAGITRDKNCRYYNQFSIIDSDGEHQESDDLLDAYLNGGINNIPEEYYFQESLMRNDFMYEYKDIDRIMEVLNIHIPMRGSFFHEKIDLPVELYNEIYDTIMGMRK